jgi:hypothetical protein
METWAWLAFGETRGGVVSRSDPGGSKTDNRTKIRIALDSKGGRDQSAQPFKGEGG